MIPYGRYTVTMLHRAENGYERYTLHGCSWKTSNEKALSVDALIYTQSTRCRIPHKYPKPMPGDLLALGEMEIAAGSEIELNRLTETLRRQGFGVFRVQSCADNTKVPIPHYTAVGV